MGKLGYWVYYECDQEYDKTVGLKLFQEINDVGKFINQEPNWLYTVIRGSECTIKSVTTVTKLKIEE